MKELVGKKINSSGGISILIMVLVIAVAVMAVITVFFPSILDFSRDSGDIGCEIALNSAQKKVNETLVLNGGLTVEEATRAATQSVTDFNNLCPAGGEMYLTPDGQGGYLLVCGLHDTDTLRRTKLNSARVLERLQALLDKAKLRGIDFPELASVQLNSKSLLVERTEEDTGLKRGTRYMMDYSGTLAYYKLEKGEITYLSFVDENHAATWRKGEGWVYDAP